MEQRTSGMSASPVRTMMTHRVRFAIRRSLITLLIPGATLLAQEKAPAIDRWDSVRALIRQTIAESNLPSISVAVAKDGKIIWEEGFGWADREKLIAATPNTMYSLASISKPITATGLMTLVERGKIDLDKPA